MIFNISVEKTISAIEFFQLMKEVGWGGDNDAGAFERSYAAYPLVVHARDEKGTLVGYLTAFSDNAFGTMLGEVIVHPKAQGQGIGKAMMRRVEEQWPGVPIYIKAMGESKHFFIACGFKIPSSPFTVLYK